MSDSTADPLAAVGEPCAAYGRHAEDWHLVDALLGGTRAMRKARELYLPKAAAETSANYEARLARTFLFDAFKRVRDALAGKPFREPVVPGDDVPADLRTMLENIDNRGTNVTVFAARALAAVLARGAVHFLVDFPHVAPAANLAEERQRGLRPYLVMIQAPDLLGWKHEYVDGIPVLVQARIREVVAEPAEFGEVEVEQIRVVEPGRWRVYRKDGDRKWALFDAGISTLPVVPLVTVRAPSDDPMTAEPPLMPLAWLNLEHWQSSSDQRHILHTARCPILVATGFPDDDDIDIGPNVLVTTPNDQARLAWVEHSGKAIEAGAKDLAAIEEKMAAFGLELLRPQTALTATQSTLNAEGAQSALGLLVAALQDGLENALGFMSLWLGRGFGEGGSLTIWKEWATDARRDQDIASLIQIRAAGDLSRETFFGEMKRRGVFADDFDPEVEAALIDEEGMRAADTLPPDPAGANDTTAGGVGDPEMPGAGASDPEGMAT